MKKLRMLSLCSGIGGADLAAEWTDGIETIGFVEINPFCQQILAKQWPDVKCLPDIRKVKGDEFGAIDLVAGGIPCQSFSKAGKRRGTSDDRFLWPYAFAIIQVARPRWVVIENVDNFVHLAFDVVAADLESEGYSVGAYLLPACAVGAPHRRTRCFVVAHSTGSRFQECQSAEWVHNQSHPSGASLANSQCLLGNQYDNASMQRGWERATQQTGMGGSDVANAHCFQQWIQPECKPECISASVSGNDGTQRTVVTASLPGEHGTWGSHAPEYPGQFESGVGGASSRISARLDRARWPAFPGEEQKTWEPPRTIKGSSPNRNKRLEALGNAIVPYQIYPIFQGIVEWERMAGGQEL